MMTQLDNKNPTLDQKIAAAIADPRNVGELSDADAVGTVGSPDCGDMLRMWVKFSEREGKKVIDRATFQTFGCETAIAVASVATELLAGKTVEEALQMDGASLSAPLGPLPPMKIHCAQLVEGALRQALAGESSSKPDPSEQKTSDSAHAARVQPQQARTLIEELSAGSSTASAPKKIVLHSDRPSNKQSA